MDNEGKIKIRGAKAHNLKNVDVDIPRRKFVVITGLSGSGKSSLAFDTIYAEGQRRYLNTLSPYAKHFMGILEKPEVESITGLSPINRLIINIKSISYFRIRMKSLKISNLFSFRSKYTCHSELISESIELDVA